MTKTTQRRQPSLVFLTLALFYVGEVGGIKVTFGTSGGPIVPPTPSPPTPPPRPPFRNPAPVWEDQTGDIPNPNPYKPPLPPQLAHLFPNKAAPTHPTSTVRPPGSPTRYTQVLYQPKPAIPEPASTVSAAKSFVQAYAQPTKTTQPSPTQSSNANNQQQSDKPKENTDYQSLDAKSESFRNDHRSQVPQLGIKYVPGYGFKYFTPEQDKDPRKYDKYHDSKHFHDKYNAIETNDIFGERSHPNDVDLSYEKYMAQRVKKSPEHQVYIAQQPFTYFQPQYFYPNYYYRH